MTESERALPLKRGNFCPPAFVLESMVAGEEIALVVVEHVHGCATCTGYVKKLEGENVAFVKQRPAELFLRQLQRRNASGKARLGPRIFGWSGLAISLAIALFLLKRPEPVQLKGGTFEVVYKRDGMPQPRPVTSDLRLRAGDALRFSYAAAKNGYLLILEVDANGKANSFYPLQGKRSLPIHSGPAQFLPGSVVLDNAPGPEWLIAIFSLQPLQVDSIVQTLPPPSPLVAPMLKCSDCQVETIRIQKEL